MLFGSSGFPLMLLLPQIAYTCSLGLPVSPLRYCLPIFFKTFSRPINTIIIVTIMEVLHHFIQSYSLDDDDHSSLLPLQIQVLSSKSAPEPFASVSFKARLYGHHRLYYQCSGQSTRAKYFQDENFSSG